MPLRKSKEYLAIIKYLESFETIKYKIKEYLHFTKEGDDDFLDIIKLNNPNKYDGDIEDSFDFLKNELKFSFLNIYEYLSNIHFNNEDGKIYICNINLEAYQLLSSSIDINPLYCYYLAKYTSTLGDNNRIRFIENNIELEYKFYGEIEKRIKIVSDMHLHLGGGLHFDIRLHNILKNIDKLTLIQKHQELFEDITSCKLKIKDIAFATSILENILIKLLYFKSNSLKKEREYIELKNDLKTILLLIQNEQQISQYLYFKKYTNSSDNIREVYYLKSFYQYNEEFEDILKKNMKRNFLNSNIPKADKYLILYFIIYLEKNREYREIIEIYFILRSIIKKFLIQQHKREGLGYFSLYSKSKIRRDKKEYEKEFIIKSLIEKRVTSYIEGRVTLSKTPHNIIKTIDNYIKHFKKKKKKGDKLKFIFHFIKEADKSTEKLKNDFDNNRYIITKPRWYNLRNLIKNQAFALNELLTNPAFRRYEVGEFDKYGNYRIKEKDYIKKYIAGIDVAGREFLTPPEVFAPIFRFFKKNIETSGLVLTRDYPYVEAEKLKEINFRYTYHVGEDFRDILSGLRAIFEAVLFLDLKDNDRIGHALALGIKPNKFLLNRRNEIKLTKLEVLDNALFAYYMIEKYNIEFLEIKNRLKEIIYGLSKEIYINFKNGFFSIDDLIDAWFLRRNSPNELFLCKSLFNNLVYEDNNNNTTYKLKELLTKDKSLHYFIPNFKYVKEAIPDFFPFERDKHSHLHRRYDSIKYNKSAYKLYWLYQKDPVVMKKGAEFYKNNFLLTKDFYEYLPKIAVKPLFRHRDIRRIIFNYLK